MHFVGGNRFSIKIDSNYFSSNDWQTLTINHRLNGRAGVDWGGFAQKEVNWCGWFIPFINFTCHTNHHCIWWAERENLFGKIKPEMNTAADTVAIHLEILKNTMVMKRQPTDILSQCLPLHLSAGLASRLPFISVYRQSSVNVISSISTSPSLSTSPCACNAIHSTNIANSTRRHVNIIDMYVGTKSSYVCNIWINWQFPPC